MAHSSFTRYFCSVPLFQKHIQLYLNNNKPQKTQKFPLASAVSYKIIKNVSALLFIFLKRWLLAIPSHNDTELANVPLWLFSHPRAIVTVFVHTLFHQTINARPVFNSRHRSKHSLSYLYPVQLKIRIAGKSQFAYASPLSFTNFKHKTPNKHVCTTASLVVYLC